MKKLYTLLFVLHNIAICQWSTSSALDSTVYACPGFTPTIRVLNDGSCFILGMGIPFLHYQIFDPYGHKAFQENRYIYNNGASSYVYSIQSEPDGEGGLIVWWRDDRRAELGYMFTPLQNAIYAQRIDKYGNKMWSDTGIVLAKLEGGIKIAHGVSDGDGGIVFLLRDQDFWRSTSPKREVTSLMRYGNNGKLIWKRNLDTSSVDGVLPFASLYRVKANILCLLRSGPAAIDTSGSIISFPSYHFVGNIYQQSDGTVLNVIPLNQQIEDSDQFRVGCKIVRMGNLLDSLKAIEYWLSDSSLLGLNTYPMRADEMYDDAGGYYIYSKKPKSVSNMYSLTVQRVTLQGPQWNGDGITITGANRIYAMFADSGGLGIVYSDFTYQRYSKSGDSVFTKRVKILDASSDDLTNVEVVKDHHGGAIITLWGGNGIRVQHSGRNGRLGVITGININKNDRRSAASVGVFPNPFNSSTTLRVFSPLQSPMTIDIYNTLGSFVRNLTTGIAYSGVNSYTLNCSDLASGVYFCSVRLNSVQYVAKLVVVK